MSYTITIRERRVKHKLHQEWVRLADTGNLEDHGPVYGYAPEQPVESIELSDVYEQTVEDLDLQAVIAAVNVKPPVPVRRHRKKE